MDEKQLLEHVIIPTLTKIQSNSNESAQVLLLGTAMVESRLVYLHQIGGGPALGIYQMEPATIVDIWDNYLKYRENLAGLIRPLMNEGMSKIEQIKGNLYYATAMARIHYRRVPKPLPQAADAVGMAAYHKEHYNTHLGATDPEESVGWFREAARIVLG